MPEALRLAPSLPGSGIFRCPFFLRQTTSRWRTRRCGGTARLGTPEEEVEGLSGQGLSRAQFFPIIQRRISEDSAFLQVRGVRQRADIDQKAAHVEHVGRQTENRRHSQKNTGDAIKQIFKKNDHRQSQIEPGLQTFFQSAVKNRVFVVISCQLLRNPFVGMNHQHKAISPKITF